MDTATMNSISDNDFASSIDYDVFATTTDPAQKPEDMNISQHNVDDHINYALEKTLSSLQISNVTSRAALLLPRTSVPEKLILCIYGNLACRRCEPHTMQALLKWVVSIYDLIDGKEQINKMYCVLFYYLNIEQLRPQLCHLLFMMTKKVHVKPYRVRFLLDLAEKVEAEPELRTLIKLFQSFNSEIVMPKKYKWSRGTAFYRIDTAFEDDLIKLRKLWRNDTTPVTPVVSSDLLSQEELDHEESTTSQTDKPRKRQRRVAFNQPAVKSLNIGIDTAELLTYVDQESIPKLISEFLSNRMVQHAIICKPNDVVIPRMCDILAQRLMDLLYWNRQTPKSLALLKDLLHRILKLARLSKAHIPVVETFLERYLKSWNGFDCVDEIFELLTYIKPSSFPDIFESFLKPLSQLYCISDVRWKAKLILCYKDWLKHWALLDWHRHADRRNATLKEGTEMAVDNLAWLFQGLSFNVNYFNVMQQLIYHVDRLCVQGLVLEQDHALLQHASLSFFEFTASISLQHDIPTIIIPAASLVYRSFFSANAMAVSRICGILYNYQLSFQDNDRKVDDWMDKNSEQYLEHFNMYVMDICNCLWRNLAFERSSEDTTAFSLVDETIRGFREKCEQRGDSLHLLFSLTHSSAFVSYSKHFMDLKTQELGLPKQSNEPVTVDTVQTLVDVDGEAMTYMDYRVEYLDYLKDLGFRGVHDLLYACMASLIERKQMDQEGSVETVESSVSEVAKN
ncbi:Mis6-domain-containing protein [Absidia repens]|uniref:Mis6-domain-containing protein n=1 Tax=Absidia repens TaxID=90262 RepID=A0A1X2I2K1_9FUNG|nr:Mis6-domain-containing protein [Absidia repens]